MTDEQLQKEAEERYPLDVRFSLLEGYNKGQIFKRGSWVAARKYSIESATDELTQLRERVKELDENLSQDIYECERLSSVANFWQKKYLDAFPSTFQPPKIDNF